MKTFLGSNIMFSTNWFVRIIPYIFLALGIATATAGFAIVICRGKKLGLGRILIAGIMFVFAAVYLSVWIIPFFDKISEVITRIPLITLIPR